MNKQLILKYKKEFDHLLEDGEILVYYPNDTVPQWSVPNTEESNSLWTCKDVKIIINDAYVELRKALAEGRTVQHDISCMNEMCKFKDLTKKELEHRDISSYCISRLRIKPDESNFKVGDWVRELYCPEQHITKLTEKEYTTIIELGHANDFELWTPQPDEYIWHKHCGLCKVIEVCDKLYELQKCFNQQEVFYSKICNLQPFIGELPTNL